MRTKNKIIIIILSVLPIVQTLAASVKSEDIIPSSLLVALQDDGTLVMQARGIPLGRILDEIRKACMVEIVGLENRRDELIGFALQSVTIEKGVKRFLRRLGENNYAFEYKVFFLSLYERSNVVEDAFPLVGSDDSRKCPMSRPDPECLSVVVGSRLQQDPQLYDLTRIPE